MADIFDPLDITLIPDEELALMDKFWAAYKSTTNNNQDYSNFWSDYYSETARKLDHKSEEWRLVAPKLQELRLSFIAFCDAGNLYGKTIYTPKPAFQQGFLLRKQEQLKRLNQASQIDSLTQEKDLLKKQVSDLQAQIINEQDNHDAKLREVKDENKDLLQKNEVLSDSLKKAKEKLSKWTLWQWATGTILSAATLVTAIIAIISTNQNTRLENEKAVLEKENRILTEELRNTKPQSGSIAPQEGLPKSSADAQASSPDSSKTRVLVPYPKDTQPHVNPQLRTFRQGK